jgi:hypothetical protein
MTIEANKQYDFGTWSNIIGYSNKLLAVALPSEFAAFSRSSKGFADLPRMQNLKQRLCLEQ